MTFFRSLFILATLITPAFAQAAFVQSDTDIQSDTEALPDASLAPDAKLLVIVPERDSDSYRLLSEILEAKELEFDVLAAVQTELKEADLFTPTGEGRYRGVILSEGGLGYQDGGNWQSAFTPEEWELLWNYERALDVPQATLYLYPSDFPEDYGLSLVAIRDTARFPSTVALTQMGRETLNPAGVRRDLFVDGQLGVRGAYMYLASVTPNSGVQVTPLLQSESGNIVAALSTSTDGRKRLAFTVAPGQDLLHSQVFADALVDWVASSSSLVGLTLSERLLRFLSVNRLGISLTILVVLFALILAALQRRRAAAQALSRYNVRPSDTRQVPPTPSQGSAPAPPAASAYPARAGSGTNTEQP